MAKVSVHWFRRDLRIKDNHALSRALDSSSNVLPLFIFDKNILDDLPKKDHRVSFIHRELKSLKKQIKDLGGDLLVLYGDPLTIWQKLLEDYDLSAVYTNEDYEPYAKQRDREVKSLLDSKGIAFHSLKDQVIYAKNDVVKEDGNPYTVYTPYKNKYLSLLKPEHYQEFLCEGSWYNHETTFPELSEFGFTKSDLDPPKANPNTIADYDKHRDIPSVDGTTHYGPYLRFGTISIRSLFRKHIDTNSVFISELIWREFFTQILYHFPKVVNQSFRSKYDYIPWRNKKEEFTKWRLGTTGYPIVDAGMRELNATGYMHNRVRMVVASFLCKHLLIDWRWGEAYFAEKLFDYDLASNNGNWQWAAGTGCDAAPYFRVFNPSSQEKKFDPNQNYIKKWVPEIDSESYPKPMVDHSMARKRALETYKSALDSFS